MNGRYGGNDSLPPTPQISVWQPRPTCHTTQLITAAGRYTTNAVGYKLTCGHLIISSG